MTNLESVNVELEHQRCAPLAGVEGCAAYHRGDALGHGLCDVRRGSRQGDAKSIRTQSGGAVFNANQP